MATHRLLIVEGRRAAVPGTGIALRVDTVRHRIASTSRGGRQRSLMTANVTLFEGTRRLAQARLVDGQPLTLGGLQLELIGSGESPSSVTLEVMSGSPTHQNHDP
jgi:hypothetical protein